MNAEYDNQKQSLLSEVERCENALIAYCKPISLPNGLVPDSAKTAEYHSLNNYFAAAFQRLQSFNKANAAKHRIGGRK